MLSSMPWPQLVQYHFRGIITKEELFINIMAGLTRDNVHEFLNDGREDIVQRMIDHAANAPENPRITCVDPYASPPTTEEDNEHERRFQEGLRIFREALVDHPRPRQT